MPSTPQDVDLDFGGDGTATGLRAPSVASDAATKTYVDSLALGGDLTGTPSNAQVAAGAITNTEVNASAAIDLSKLAVDPRARSTHTGTQLASTISDFATAAGGTAVGGDLTGTMSNAQIGSGAVGPTELGSTARAFAATIGGRAGTLAVETALTTKTPRWYNRLGRTVTIAAVHAAVDTAPAGSAITVAVRKNGAGANDATVTIAAAASTGSATGLSLTVADGDYLQVWTTAVGSSTAGTDLSVQAVGTWA